jgi:hypothetical protein
MTNNDLFDINDIDFENIFEPSVVFNTEPRREMRTIHEICLDEFYVSEDYGAQCMMQKSEFELLELARANAITNRQHISEYMLRMILIEVYNYRVRNNNVINEENVSQIIVIISHQILQNSRAVYSNEVVHLNNLRLRRNLKRLLNIKLKHDSEMSKDHRECPVCYDKVKLLNRVSTDCSHVFCLKCVNSYMSTAKRDKDNKINCPMCRSTISELSVFTKTNLKLLQTKCYAR